MKKKIGLALCLATLIFTACGKSEGNSLTCTDVQYNGAYVSDTIVEYDFEGKEIVGTKLKAVVDFEGKSVDEVGCSTNTIEECVNDLIAKMQSTCNSQDSLVENCQISNQTQSGFEFTSNVKKQSLAQYFGSIPLQTDKATLKQKIESGSSTRTCN